PAGELFYQDATSILQQVERAKDRVRQRARGEHLELRLGFAASTASSSVVLEKVRQLHETIPDLQLIAVEHPMPELARMIQEKQLDIAFMRLPCYASEALRRKILFDDPFVAVIPAVHTLAEVEKIQLIQLNHENVLMFPREVGPALYDNIEAAFSAAGVNIARSYAAPQLRTAITMAQAGFGIAIVPLSLTEHLDHSVVVKTIQDMPFVSQVAIVSDAGHHHPLLNRCIACMGE
ncbi:LysR family transcriptional regulator, partial [Vibrio cholerae]